MDARPLAGCVCMRFSFFNAGQTGVLAVTVRKEKHMEEDFKSMNSRENEQLKVTSQAEVADAARMAGDYQIIDNYLCIRMPEEVDHHRSDEICKNADHYILESQVGNVVFDFEDTHFMDSSGIGILIGRYKLISCFGGKVFVLHAGRQIRRMLQLAGLDRIVEIME